MLPESSEWQAARQYQKEQADVREIRDILNLIVSISRIYKTLLQLFSVI